MVKQYLEKTQLIFQKFMEAHITGDELHVDSYMEDFVALQRRICAIVEAQDGMADYLAHELEIARKTLENCARKLEMKK